MHELSFTAQASITRYVADSTMHSKLMSSVELGMSPRREEASRPKNCYLHRVTRSTCQVTGPTMIVKRCGFRCSLMDSQRIDGGDRKLRRGWELSAAGIAFSSAKRHSTIGGVGASARSTINACVALAP